jgi:hypothetical protein
LGEGGGWKTWQEEDLLVGVKESSQGERKEKKKRAQEANRVSGQNLASNRTNPLVDGAR